MAYYDGVVCVSSSADLHAAVGGTVLLLSSLTQTVNDPVLFTPGGSASASYISPAYVQDAGWPKADTGGGTGETVEVTSVAILVDGSWRQAVGQQLAADGLWHSQ